MRSIVRRSRGVYRSFSSAQAAPKPDFRDSIPHEPHENSHASKLYDEKLNRLAAEEKKYSAYIYDPIPVVFAEAKGAVVTDVNGKKYLDFLAAYSAVNQGHCHPKIMEAMVKQSKRVTISSRAFYNDMLLPFCKLLDETFGYEKALLMNTGVEGGETAQKIGRRWAYRHKKIPKNQCITIMAKGNFWGRTMSACSSSMDPDLFLDFGPYMPNYEFVNYNDLKDLRKKFEEKGDRIGMFMVEPIQGEAGVKIPDPGYLKGVRKLCDEFNVLFIADEVQTGLGRTGKMMACEHEGVKPDILILAKALSGGAYPVSAVLTSTEIMQYIDPGSHGSTYGGNSMACAVGMAAVNVILEENLCERSTKLGHMFRDGLKELVDELPAVTDVRGVGLMNAMEIHSDKANAWDLCLKLAENGLITKPTHGDMIRFTPPLVIEEAQLETAINTIKKCTRELFA